MLVIRHRIWSRENDRGLVGLPKKGKKHIIINDHREFNRQLFRIYGAF
jgi:hypothetical protein